MNRLVRIVTAIAALVFVKRGPNRIDATYKKVHYVEYANATFTKRKPRPPESRNLGIVGPIIHAEVGDKIRIVFRNMASRLYSIHPHGVFYTKANDGAPSNDGTSGADRADDAVAPAPATPISGMFRRARDPAQRCHVGGLALSQPYRSGAYRAAVIRFFN